MLEGWYTDPYDRHQQRWMSAGTPTALVADDSVTSNDEPPDGPWVHDPEPLPESKGGPGDLLRADAAEAQPEEWRQASGGLWSDEYGVGPLLGGKPAVLGTGHTPDRDGTGVDPQP